MTTEERLEKVERELAATRRRSRWLLAGVALCLAIGLGASAFGPSAAQAGAAAPAIIRAQLFELVDAAGEPRAMLALTKDGTMLALYDAASKPRASLSVFEDEPVLALIDAVGKTRAMLDVTADGPGLHLFDAAGRPMWSAP